MGCRVSTSLRYSLLLSVPVWCAFVSSEAMAACTNNPPANNQTVDCTGAGNAAVIAPTGITGVTVNVSTGASITGVAQTVAGTNAQYSSVLVNGTSTVNNSGTISPTLPNVSRQRDYVGVNLNGSDTTLNNTGTINVTNAANVVTNPGSNTYRLYGVISSSNTAADFENVTVNNNGSIIISQSATGTANAGAVARGVYAGENIDSMTINNFGTIQVTRASATAVISTTAYAGIDADNDVEELTVNNSGTIRATGVNAFAVGGRAMEYSLTNYGTITADGTNPRGAIVIYGGAVNDAGQGASGQSTIVNTATGVVNGNVLIADQSPLANTSTVPGANIGIAATAITQIRDSEITNQGTINGAFTYGAGTHVLDNSGTITGSIFVLQAAAPAGSPNVGGAPVGIGGASFTLTNSGTLGGDITIRDRADSVNSITLQGTGFAGNVVAVNGTGSNSLDLRNVTNLASVQNFTNLNLRRSNVAVPGGVSLVTGATVNTVIYGPGGTRAAPSTNLGTINGTLTLAGPTTLGVRVRGTFVRNGDTYQVASAVAGAGANQITLQQRQSALVGASRVDTSDGRLLLITNVRDPRTFAGVSQPAGATLNGLLTYNGNNPQVRALGAAVEALPTQAAVRAAGDALSPITNGADVQIPINSVMAFHQQIESRLDAYIFAQIPASGRSADLGVARPAPVYGVLPPNGAWIEGIGGGIHQSSVNGVQGYNAQLTGVIGGYDRLITPNIRVGGAFGYIDGRVNGNDSGGRRENIQTFQGLGYAALEGRNYYLRGSAGYGGVNFASTRQISFPGFNDVAFGTHSGNIFTARGEGGVPLEYLNSLVIPYAAFTYSRLQQNAYTDVSGNGAGLSYQSARNNSERSEVGGKVIVPIVNMPVFSYLFPRGSVVAVEARAAYVHEFGNVGQTVAASFTGGGGVFVAAGPVPNRDMVDYGVGLRMGSGPVQIDISYNGLARSTYLQQVGLLRARYVF